MMNYLFTLLSFQLFLNYAIDLEQLLTILFAGLDYLCPIYFLYFDDILVLGQIILDPIVPFA